MLNKIIIKDMFKINDLVNKIGADKFIHFFKNGLFDVNDLKFDTYGAFVGGLLALILLLI